MIIFVVGGSKSGKSAYGEVCAKSLSDNKGKLYYLATMKPYDLEDIKRIENHVESRKEYCFETIEKEKDISEITNMLLKEDTLLLDSITSLATNEMFDLNIYNENISSKITNAIEEISLRVKNIVIVSDYVFSDSIIYDSYTENFKKELGLINCNIAKIADVVVEAVYGNLIVHKGRELLKDEKLI